MSSMNASMRRAADTPLQPRALSHAIHIAIATAAFAVPAGAAFAQAASTSLPTVTVSSEGEAGYAAPRSTTATKSDTPLRDTPQSISVVTKEQIRDTAAQSMAEATKYVPGVGFAQGEGNRETPIFRGISSTGDFFIDGIRDDVQYYRDLYNIERVEVFKGPNAMIFGRGATGGLINRTTKQAGWTPSIGGSLTLGSDSNKRLTADINQPISDQLAFRLNALHENSDSYRDGVSIKRSGINPTLAWRAGAKTLVTVGYEYFKDDRIADRGISSFRGAPLQVDPATFFGNAAASPTGTTLNAFTASVEHEFENGLQLRNRLRITDQDKFYQNVFPGAVNAAGTQVALSAYNNATSRKSVFNQTDFNYTLSTGAVKHKLAFGAELGQQDTDNFRNTGFFPGNVTSINVPLGNPTTQLPVTFSQSATDANNSGKAKVAALYLQDQIELGPQFQVIGGLRYDRFTVDFRNNRNGQQFDTSDGLVSPRIGVVYKPQEAVSLYANYSVAYQPRAGDQLSSLSLTNAALKPEKFKNFEIGAKWDVRSNLALTAALYRLDRTNVIVLDPSDPTNTRTMLSDGQRSQGFELGLSGNVTPAWSVAGGYTYADAKFTADTSATQRAGGAVGQVPRHTLALWNRYDFTPAWGAGLGVIHRTKMFAANELIATAANTIPNVVLPGYTRMDAAVFYTLSKSMQLQLNVENLFNKKYFINANSNNNITPGAPRSFRLALNAKF
ncbi:catecholate siderophore receptor [Acidovorax soli]|uniref:Catecholate siderophore receptor n=1 Tax=Acidovorax soli TaxID=592050 RepID=A0A7X0PDB4_9BURK|nr:TonB-dependent siderophore receptor [Acidovorax soli]MBB6559823.1 catecholate siderophore receptor [Acidovorax soli]